MSDCRCGPIIEQEVCLDNCFIVNINSLMSDDKFFRNVAAKAAVPQLVVDFLKTKYKTKKALCENVDAGGPDYTDDWKTAGLKERQIHNIRMAVINLRLERRDASCCAIM